jgi:hypothetical protein
VSFEHSNETLVFNKMAEVSGVAGQTSDIYGWARQRVVRVAVRGTDAAGTDLHNSRSDKVCAGNRTQR